MVASLGKHILRKNFILSLEPLCHIRAQTLTDVIFSTDEEQQVFQVERRERGKSDEDLIQDMCVDVHESPTYTFVYCSSDSTGSTACIFSLYFPCDNH